MSFDGAITLEWGGKPRRFRLPIGLLGELCKARDCGPEEIAARLAPFDPPRYRPEDIRDTLRLGLVGGGLGRTEAETLAVIHIDKQPLAFHRAPAFEVLAAALAGPTDNQKKRLDRAASLSTSNASTSLEAPSDGTLASSMT